MSFKIAHLAKVFFCTGARNHELLKLLDERPLDFEFDERMASFKALGLTKALHRPVAVCTTSGTAVSECVSAMLEARYSNAPLVLISGDRPKKLHGTGSPQTIDHEPLTQSARGMYLEVTLEEFKILEIKDVCFPLHINVLIDDTLEHNLKVIRHQDLAAFETFLENKKSVLFLFSHEEGSMRPLIQEFKSTGQAFYAESMSGGRDLSPIGSERELIDLLEENTFDAIVRVGHTPLSKIWRLLEKNPLPVFHLDNRDLAALSYGEVLPLGAKDLLKSDKWWSLVKSLTPLKLASVRDLKSLLTRYPGSEMGLMRKLQNNFHDGAAVYLGNSLIIRFFELTQTKPFEVFGNRGVNGIDGQLATAIGLAQGMSSQVYCILGDITTLYDLSAMRDLPRNLKLIIMNNKGGRIFDMLGLDKRIVMEHESEFKNIAQGFGLSYSQKLDDLSQVQVLELFPDEHETKSFLREWNQ